MDIKPITEFLAHVDLTGLFDVYVIPVKDGTRFQFFPYPPLKDTFPQFLAGRFPGFGEPAEAVFHAEINCFDVFFRGLHFKDPEDALRRLTAGR